MEEVGNSNPVFLIIHKKAAIRSYLCSAFQKRSFLPLKQQKTMKNALFFMVFCLAAFSSAIMANIDKNDNLSHFLYSESNYFFLNNVFYKNEHKTFFQIILNPKYFSIMPISFLYISYPSTFPRSHGCRIANCCPYRPHTPAD